MPGLLIGCIVSAAIAISATVLPQWPWLYFIFKPLTTILVIARAWPRGEPGSALRRALLAGLVFSLAGDIALMWPKEGFLPGLVAFLVAHLCYLVAFTRGTRLAARPIAYAVYAVLAAVILAALWPGVPTALRWPVVAYVVCLAAMAAQATTVWLVRRGTAGEGSAQLAAIGGALFLASDALLATNKFMVPLPVASLWILGTYWSAQWLIASSMRSRR